MYKQHTDVMSGPMVQSASLRYWQHRHRVGKRAGAIHLPAGPNLHVFRNKEAWASGPLNIHLKSRLSSNSAEVSAKRAHSPFLVFRSRRRKETGERVD
jgi:hypothetical protein